MPRGAGSLVLTALCIQALAAFAPPASDPCACTDSTCCRTAKRPAAPRASCHDDESAPPASLRCHHPEQDVRLPATIALLPAAASFVPAERPRQIARRPAPGPRAGFSRRDLPPPRFSRPA